jgi:ionotropic glutamate receptor NMDA 2B
MFIQFDVVFRLGHTEPFDTASWLLVGVVAIQVAWYRSLAIFLFEWLSPSGYNMQVSV